MSDTGSLSVIGNEFIGISGTGTFAQSGGTSTVGNILLLGFNSSGGFNSRGNGTYNLSAGSLSTGFNEVIGHSGTGTFNQSGGTNTIDFNLFLYTQSALGTYAVEIGGLLAGSQYDVLNVSGSAFLDGLLNVSLFDLGSGLFVPHAGDYFDILTADMLFGNFSSMSFAALSDPNLFWQISYLADYIGTTDVVRLSVAQHVAPPPPVPEPETYAMLLAGLGLLGFNARRRKNCSA